MSIAIVCEAMHWTYQEYDSQPEWLLDALRIKLEEDSKHSRKISKGKGK